MRRIGWKIRMAIVLCGVLFMIPGLSLAQPYPNKPINLLVSFAPGGTLDSSIRLLTGKAEKMLGQPFVITNNGGGGGSVALGIVSKQSSDGYHLVGCTSTGMVGLPQYRVVTYSHEDFIPIMHYAAPQTGLVVKSSSPWKTIKDLVEHAKKNPGKVTYSVPGVGSTMHLAMEFVAQQEGIKWTYVTFSGGPEAMTNVLGGHVNAMSDSAEWLPHVKSGDLRLLATHGERRMKDFPDVPTFRELGYNYVNPTVFLLAVPKNTPPAIVKTLNDALQKAADDPEFVKALEKMDMTVIYRNSEDAKKYLQGAYAMIGKMIKDFNLPTELKKPEQK